METLVATCNRPTTQCIMPRPASPQAKCKASNDRITRGAVPSSYRDNPPQIAHNTKSAIVQRALWAVWLDAFKHSAGPSLGTTGASYAEQVGPGHAENRGLVLGNTGLPPVSPIDEKIQCPFLSSGNCDIGAEWFGTFLPHSWCGTRKSGDHVDQPTIPHIFA